MTGKKQYQEIKNLTQTQIEQQMLAYWKAENVFEKSITTREGKPSFVFYEGPPSANGMPGIHLIIHGL